MAGRRPLEEPLFGRHRRSRGSRLGAVPGASAHASRVRATGQRGRVRRGLRHARGASRLRARDRGTSDSRLCSASAARSRCSTAAEPQFPWNAWTVPTPDVESFEIVRREAPRTASSKSTRCGSDRKCSSRVSTGATAAAVSNALLRLTSSRAARRGSSSRWCISTAADICSSDRNDTCRSCCGPPTTTPRGPRNKAGAASGCSAEDSPSRITTSKRPATAGSRSSMSGRKPTHTGRARVSCPSRRLSCWRRAARPLLNAVASVVIAAAWSG